LGRKATRKIKREPRARLFYDHAQSSRRKARTCDTLQTCITTSAKKLVLSVESGDIQVSLTK